VTGLRRDIFARVQGWEFWRIFLRFNSNRGHAPFLFPLSLSSFSFFFLPSSRTVPPGENKNENKNENESEADTEADTEGRRKRPDTPGPDAGARFESRPIFWGQLPGLRLKRAAGILNFRLSTFDF
jgi:hypothetical protein